MNSNSSKPYQTPYFIGLALTALSFYVYLLSRNELGGDLFFSQSFFVNYGIAVGYFIFLLIYRGKFERPKPQIAYSCLINLVLLFTISAFSLNKEMTLFATFPTWLNVYTLLLVALFLVYPYVNGLPVFIKALVYLLTGCALILAVYMGMYLMVMIPITVLTFWFFGISLHALVPAVWVWVIIDFLMRKTERTHVKHFLWAGILIPLIILGVYLKKWNNFQVQIKDILAEKNLQLENQLPAAIQLAQKLPSDPLTDEILMSPFKSQTFWSSGFGINNDGATKFHDPLSVIGIALFGELDIDEQTAETVLNIRKDYRHKSTRKLWTGMSLSTSAVSNNIRVFPEYRLAYHEKTLVIHNDPDKINRDAWFVENTQEALYTFHVPEGSIVTSLSLWINGKEQKSRLSTSQKADSAYTTIVGAERRDPAVVHWREGNRVTVTVFPCTKEEDRTFKIGFTSPLSLKEGNLWLENIWFECPDFNRAREATSVFMEGKATSFIEMPDYFEKNAKGEFVYKGDYNPDWKIAMKPVPLSANKFSFNGYAYSLKELSLKQKTLQVKQVFLDVTKEWSREEYDAIIAGMAAKPVFTWLPEKVQITNDNKELVWEAVKDNQFSMPFLYDITDPEQTMVVTKTGATSPLLSDMAQSNYADKTIAYLVKSNHKITVVNIGKDLSPLWRSLHELRLIDYNTGSLQDVNAILKTGIVNYAAEDSSTVSLSESYMSITKEKSSGVAVGNAPDHLLRMFAYNDVLRKIGRTYFEKEKYEASLFREAEEGYVVTPVTSMIVLESEADYERMGIGENRNTVGNAWIVSGGAVPEPHEWLLIGLVLSLIIRHLYLKYKGILGSYSRK